MHDQTAREAGRAGALGGVPGLRHEPARGTAIPKQAGRPNEKDESRVEAPASGDKARPKRARSGQAPRPKGTAGNGRGKASAGGKAKQSSRRPPRAAGTTTEPN